MTDALVLERDLFFVAKIRETLKAAGRTCVMVKSVEDLAAQMTQSPPSIVLVHIGVAGIDWERAITLARAAGVPVLAYGSHVDIAAQRAARAAGATRVIANSKLAADLPGQLDRTLARAVAAAPPAPDADEIDEGI
jgi:DNA-binding NarL/FixJ family response regulator